MAVKKNYQIMLKNLKKQIRVLQRREEQAKNKLRSALKKMRKLGRAYQTKLTVKARQMKGKIAEAQAVTYAKVAVHLERQLLKGIDAKSKALESAITKIEKKHAIKLKKSLAAKSKKAGKAKKASRGASTKTAKGRRGPHRRK